MQSQFEVTSSREICGFFDLANTYKILAEDDGTDGFWIAGGFFNTYSYNHPLSDLVKNYDKDDIRDFRVAWLVLKK